MRKTLKFIISLAVALLFMVVFRAVGLTIYTIDGDGLQPTFIAGDRIMVNRWSYGLRVGGGVSDFFSYGRLWRQHVNKGDIVAFENPTDGDIIICQCKGLPGDTLDVDGETLMVPSLKDCADADYYWMETIGSGNDTDSRLLGFISEEYIIGRVMTVVYSHDPGSHFWEGWRNDRLFKPIGSPR
jgi:signal peptidase I